MVPRGVFLCEKDWPLELLRYPKRDLASRFPGFHEAMRLRRLLERQHPPDMRPDFAIGHEREGSLFISAIVPIYRPLILRWRRYVWCRLKVVSRPVMMPHRSMVPPFFSIAKLIGNVSGPT